MATVYNVMLYGGLALAIVFAIVAVVLFFVLKIPKAVGIATGSTARKKIDEIKEKGYESVQGGGASKQEAIKNHTSRISVRDVKSTAVEKHSEKGMANYEKAIADLGKKRLEDEGETATDILRDDAEEATDILREDEENLDINGSSFEEATDILREDSDEEATDVLRNDEADEEATDILRSDEADEEATDILRSDEADEEATDILRSDDADEEATDVLRSDDADDSTAVLQGGRSASSVRMIKNVIIVHSDEEI